MYLNGSRPILSLLAAGRGWWKIDAKHAGGNCLIRKLIIMKSNKVGKRPCLSAGTGVVGVVGVMGARPAVWVGGGPGRR